MLLAFSDHGRSNDSQVVFGRMPKQNLVAGNALVSSLSRAGDLTAARLVFEDLPERDSISWNTLLIGAVEESFRIDGGDSNPARIDGAKKLFLLMPALSLVSWNAMISACARSNRVTEAQTLFDQMPDHDTVSLTAIFQAYALNGHLQEAKRMFDSTTQRDSILWMCMVRAYIEDGQIQRAHELFDRMDGRDSSCWTSMVQAHAVDGNTEDSIAMHERMPYHGRIASTSVLTAYSQAGNLSSAKAVFETMQERDIVAWTAILTAYAQRGYNLETSQTFKMMPEWRYAQNGHCDSAIEAFRAMNLEGDAAPNDISLTNVLAACGHKGLLEMSRECFVSVSSDYGLKQCKEQYSCVVDLLGRLGEIEIAEEIVKAMPFVADDVVWGSVLGACRTQEENGMRAAVQAVDWIAQLNPDNGSCYILLANMYATTNP
ncbi:pentatricopeptide repeat-containing protein At4g02750 [Selaginella moellendorffii]|uniref:pentatricopeptide repeat-containing protein At4g02750 n=1 Tax=Selaginella moellendorffii TaxID=88036 RepID=UPI000D1C5217|nr:pentatricopeptide repeat-containing protein At4g02750 [Selaginella moellendorffii]|eukprot:XP_024521938.1 pentatricopeptide repeat-containing protein At4g02750 [Selaginella moellendorffii]